MYTHFWKKEPIGKKIKLYFPLTGGSVLDNGGRMNSVRKSIHGTSDSMMEDARTTLGNQFVGLRTRWWRMHELKSIHGALNKI